MIEKCNIRCNYIVDLLETLHSPVPPATSGGEGGITNLLIQSYTRNGFSAFRFASNERENRCEGW